MSEGVIMLWGIARDAPMAAVRRSLARSRVRVAFVDQRAFLDGGITLTFNATTSGSMRGRDCDVVLDDVTAMYLRPYDLRRLLVAHKVEVGSSRWQVALEHEDLLSCWSEITSALVINRPSAMASNNSK